MFKKKGVILIAIVVVLTVFVYYRYSVRVLQVNKGEDTVPTASVPTNESKRVSAEVKYNATEDDEDTLRFILTVDKDGVITDVSTVDAETNKVWNDRKFNQGLTTVIKGKKLSELTSVDKIGTSTYTTKAFNGVIDELKAQL